MTKTCLLLIVCGTLVSGATQSRQLPVFPLTTIDGSAVSSDTLAETQPWLLVIAQQPCPACGGTFAALNERITEGQRTRIVVVVASATAAQAAAMAARYPRVGATWLVDPGRAALPAFGLGGAPAIVGLNGSTVHWTRGIASATPSELESLVSSWLR